MRNKSLFAGLSVICMATVLLAATGDAGLGLIDAAERGDLKTVSSLVQKFDVNAARGDGMTALLWATYQDDLEMARVLIKAGANVNAANRLKAVTPLLIASNNGNAALVDLLLKAGADSNLANAQGSTPLMLAAASGSVDAVKTLLDHGANVNAKESVRGQTALMFAAALNRDAAVRLLAARGADLNATTKVASISTDIVDEDGNAVPAQSRTGATQRRPRGEGKATGMGGMTALHYAAREGLIASIQALVETGVDVNKVNALDKSSALVIAISNGHYDAAKYLVDHGADPNLASIDGLAALYATVQSRWSPVAWTPNAFTSADGISQQATNHLDLMKDLLAHGANPNAKINKTLWFDPPHHNESWAKAGGTTPFWRAAQANDLDAMKLLVSHDADPKIASDEKTTPLAVAAGVGWNGNYSTNAPDSFMTSVKYLVEEIGLDVNAADATGYTPVMGAAYRGDNEMIRYLITKGARLDVKTKRGWSVTDMANGPYLRSSFPLAHPETVALLQKQGAPPPTKVDDEEILGVIKRSKPIRLEDLTWEEVAEGIKEGTTTALIYAGGGEENGPHMTFGKHTAIANYVGEQIARQLGNAVLYPVIPFAPSGDPTAKIGAMAFPGSTSVSNQTFASVVRDLALSAITAGFKNVVLLGDHGGGQEELKNVASELTEKYKAQNVRVHFCSDAYKKAGDEFNKYLASKGISETQAGHAGARDTAEILFLKPEWIRTDKIREASKEKGVPGDPSVATAELGKVYLDMKIKFAATEIRRLIGSGSAK